VINSQKYRRGVLRDLEWLFNTSEHASDELGGDFKLKDFPEAARSVINFGTRQICGLMAPNMEELEGQMVEAIQLFEPRIIPHTFSLAATMERNVVSFQIEGELWANPVPEKLFIKTTIDLESGQCILGDSTDGRTAS
jgi:type VI secretion system protein ImpF